MFSGKDSALAFTLKGGRAVSGNGVPAGVSQDEARVDLLMRGDDGPVVQRDRSDDDGWAGSLNDQLRDLQPVNRGSIGNLDHLQAADGQDFEALGEDEIDEEEYGDE